MTLTRRKLLGHMFLMSAGQALRPALSAVASSEQAIEIKPDSGTPVPLPGDFVGLGYEMSSVAVPGLLRSSNHPYVALVRNLGNEGIIRVGGIVADYTRYEASGTMRADRQDTVITRAGLEQFGDFLAATGWKTIWSLNLAQGTLQDAVIEAKAVTDVLGSRLQALEFGNEVENYSRGRKPFRQPSYDYEAYRAEYSAWHAAISKAAPGVEIAAPDTASSVKWVERMAEDAHGDVQLLTTHYYRNGQVKGSSDQLLAPDPSLTERLIRLRAASLRSGIPWRMCEANSFSGGGRPGVSDTFLAALWTLDFMLLLAQNGCGGVNLETGVNQLGFISSYSPIADNGKGVNSAGVPYYGMLAFAVARRGNDQVIPINFSVPNERVTAYALGTKAKVRSLVVINRDRSSNCRLNISGMDLHGGAMLRLSAPSPDSKDDVRFGGGVVNSKGRWRPHDTQPLESHTLIVPAMSAAVILQKGAHKVLRDRA